MDTIDVEIREIIENRPIICLILNGEYVASTFNVYKFIVSHLYKRGTFEILTCTCGEAGCAGIFEGTKIKNRKHTVEWRDIDCGLPKRFYSFDRRQYLSTIDKAIQLIYDVAKYKQDMGMTDHEYYDAILNDLTVEDAERRINWIYEYHRSSIQYRDEWSFRWITRQI